jgi:Flp pilus assembly pilin Flp
MSGLIATVAAVVLIVAARKFGTWLGRRKA